MRPPYPWWDDKDPSPEHACTWGQSVFGSGSRNGRCCAPWPEPFSCYVTPSMRHGLACGLGTRNPSVSSMRLYGWERGAGRVSSLAPGEGGPPWGLCSALSLSSPWNSFLVRWSNMQQYLTATSISERGSISRSDARTQNYMHLVWAHARHP